MSRETQGWACPSNSKKWHYFVEGRALCGKWGYGGELEPDNGKESPDDCRECRNKFNKLNPNLLDTKKEA